MSYCSVGGLKALDHTSEQHIERNRYTGRKGERKIPALSLLTKAKPLHSEGQNESEGESKGEKGEREVSEKEIEHGGVGKRGLRNR